METEQLQALVERAKLKDNEAIGQLIAFSQNKLFFVAKSYVKNEADAADVLQNAYIKAFSSLNTLADSSKFEGWITRIVTNTALDHMKKSTFKYDVKFADLADDDEDQPYDPADERIDYQPELSLSQKETQKIIQEIIDSLSDEQRIAVMMHFYDGMTTREIAETLGCKDVTVKARIRYAKEKIKESVIAIQKRDGIKLYNLAPLPFFLYLLRSYAGAAYGTSGTAAAVTAASRSITVHAAAASGKTAAAKSTAGIILKVTLAAAVTAGSAAIYHVATTKKQQIQTGLYTTENEDVNIQLNADETFAWQYSNQGTLQKDNGTYTIKNNQLILSIANDTTGCTFNIDSDKLTAASGSAAECIKGTTYQYEDTASATPSATPETLTNDEIYQILINNGYQVTDINDESYATEELNSKPNNMYVFTNDSRKISFYTCNGSDTRTKAGFAYRSKQSPYGSYDRTAEGGTIDVTCMTFVDMPGFIVENNDNRNPQLIGYTAAVHGSGCTHPPIDDSVVISEAKTVYAAMQTELLSLGITEDDMFRFGSTYTK